jgi:RecA/RadA recombinase
LDCRGNQFKSGLEVKEKRRAIINLTTGSTQLDKILGGGVETGSITDRIVEGDVVIRDLIN